MTTNSSPIMDDLEQLEKKGADRFDPFAFFRIKSLYLRAQKQRQPVRKRLELKVEKLLSDYKSRFEKACDQAKDIVNQANLKHPGAVQNLTKLIEACDFQGACRLHEELKRKNGHGAFCEKLTTLTREIDQKNVLSHAHIGTDSLEDILYQQQAQVVQSFGDKLIGDHVPRNGQKAELTSFRLFKQTWTKLHSERVVAHTVKTHPENPGPLNSQMLATRSLEIMRDLSPSYLNRFVTYIETLLWLDRVDKGY